MSPKREQRQNKKRLRQSKLYVRQVSWCKLCGQEETINLPVFFPNRTYVDNDNIYLAFHSRHICSYQVVAWDSLNVRPLSNIYVILQPKQVKQQRILETEWGFSAVWLNTAKDRKGAFTG